VGRVIGAELLVGSVTRKEQGFQHVPGALVVRGLTQPGIAAVAFAPRSPRQAASSAKGCLTIWGSKDHPLFGLSPDI
jgi:hypothetical protein